MRFLSFNDVVFGILFTLAMIMLVLAGIGKFVEFDKYMESFDNTSTVADEILLEAEKNSDDVKEIENKYNSVSNDLSKVYSVSVDKDSRDVVCVFVKHIDSGKTVVRGEGCDYTVDGVVIS